MLRRDMKPGDVFWRFPKDPDGSRCGVDAVQVIDDKQEMAVDTKAPGTWNTLFVYGDVAHSRDFELMEEDEEEVVTFNRGGDS